VAEFADFGDAELLDAEEISDLVAADVEHFGHLLDAIDLHCALTSASCDGSASEVYARACARCSRPYTCKRVREKAHARLRDGHALAVPSIAARHRLRETWTAWPVVARFGKLR
jgi:hypothetical protein